MIASMHRPTRVEIDLAAISSNLQQVAAHLPEKTKVFAVVKANAYGHGVQAVAEELAAQVDGFCVSNIDEAVELRQYGIEKDVLVLGVVPTSAVSLAIKHHIILTVASQEWLDRLKDTDVAGLRVHLKIDSGMGRIGFRDSSQVNEAIQKLQEAEARVEGIFTHFATADQKDEEQFHAQLQAFKRLLSELTVVPAMVHASNSATSVWHADTVFSMVRLGNILYGLNPSGHDLALPYPIKPALRLVSEVVHSKVTQAGDKVGYGGTYTCSEPECIATVPIGYADGLLRGMQGFSVLVDGQACPIVGRVSMDQITIRLPKPYPLGTKVTLIGMDKDREVSVQDWADYLGTINYEIVCLLSDRIPRYYSKKEH